MKPAHPSRIERSMEPLLGRTAWQVRKGSGSFLTFEFGAPSLVIREPIPGGMLAGSRNVTVRGEWHLWIYCCHWEITRDGELQAHCESSDETIVQAAAFLDGQRLEDVTVSSDGSTVFRFDLGGTLVTRGYPEDLDDEQWMLYEPDGNVLTVRGDGRYSWEPGRTPPSETRWVAPTDEGTRDMPEESE